jgi:predicted transcriptional regulator
MDEAAKRFKKICINVEPELLRKAKVMARMRTWTYSMVIRAALREYIDNHKEDQPK